MKSKIDLSKISTESINQQTKDIDLLPTIQQVAKINQQDQQVALAVKTQLNSIAKAIDKIAQAFNRNARLVYMGAGTSGRLGVLDASEMPPTFGVSNKMVVGLIAGGDKALRSPIEGAEDDEALAVRDLTKIHLNKNDVLVGISASGRTPYVIAGLKYANKLGATTVSVATAKNSAIGKIAKIKIEAVTGAEVITGSTRMKSGTVQKMILNMLSTGAMIKIGKTYGNLMVDVQPTNEKLIVRAHTLVKIITHATDELVDKTLKLTHGQVKPAIVMLIKKVDYKTATKLLNENNNILKKAIH